MIPNIPNYKKLKVVIPEAKYVRYKPEMGYHKKNDGMVTHFNPEEIGSKDVYNMAILPVPKNASSTLRRLIWNTTYKSKQTWSDPAHMVDLTEHYNRVDDIIVVLRDPYDRFLSALNMFLSTRQWDGGCIKMGADEDEIIFLNEHFFPQSYYLESVLTAPPKILEKLRFFYMSQTADITRDIVQQFPMLIRYEEAEENRNMTNRSHKVVTDVNKPLIESMYKEDFDLIEQTKFLNAGKIKFNRDQ